MIVKCFSTQASKCKKQLFLHNIYKDKLNNNGYISIYQLLISGFNCYIQVIRDLHGDVVYFTRLTVWSGGEKNGLTHNYFFRPETEL